MRVFSLASQTTRYGQNPFSTSRVRPAAMPYIFLHESNLVHLMRRYDRFHGWGQIIGPHGSGKSTLLHWLRRQIEQRSKPVILVSLHREPRPNLITTPKVRDLAPGTQLLIDGYEQLSWRRRYWLERQCRKSNVQLMVTAHRSLGFATLLRTHVTAALAQAIVSRLLVAEQCVCKSDTGVSHALQCGERPFICPMNIQQQLARHSGNMRETLFSLYDMYEQMRQAAGCDSRMDPSDGSRQPASTTDETGESCFCNRTFRKLPI